MPEIAQNNSQSNVAYLEQVCTKKELKEMVSSGVWGCLFDRKSIKFDPKTYEGMVRSVAYCTYQDRKCKKLFKKIKSGDIKTRSALKSALCNIREDYFEESDEVSSHRSVEDIKQAREHVDKVIETSPKIISGRDKLKKFFSNVVASLAATAFLAVLALGLDMFIASGVGSYKIGQYALSHYEQGKIHKEERIERKLKEKDIKIVVLMLKQPTIELNIESLKSSQDNEALQKNLRTLGFHQGKTDYIDGQFGYKAAHNVFNFMRENEISLESVGDPIAQALEKHIPAEQLKHLMKL